MTSFDSQVVKGAESCPFMISPSGMISRSPGLGRMACCDRNHVKANASGVRQIIPCRKDQMAPLMLAMLRSLRAHHFGRDEFLDFRMLTALSPSLMSGLPFDGLSQPPQSVTEFLTQYGFSESEDELASPPPRHSGPRALRSTSRSSASSGFSPLIFAALSGNVVVARELVNSHRVDVNALTQVGVPKYGVDKGMDALGVAVGGCPQTKVHEMVSFLLASGADPNMCYSGSGATTLMGAILWRSLEGVRSLLSCAGDRLDLEKGLKANNATALLIGANVGTLEILDVLLQAGANRQHK